MPNIEIKARCPSLDAALHRARDLNCSFVGEDHQVDTYFKTSQGRLKIRESSLSGNFLIPYLRKDAPGPKKSDYQLIKLEDPIQTKELFSQLLGVETIVDKQRIIFLYENVRIHLDRLLSIIRNGSAVDMAGHETYIEFEAVYESGKIGRDDRLHYQSHQTLEAEETAKVYDLMRQFNVKKDDLIKGSYRESIP